MIWCVQYILICVVTHPMPSRMNIKAATFDLHESHCRRHILYCAECEEGVPRQEFDEHVEECHAPSACPLCGESVKKHLLDDHKVRGHEVNSQNNNHC